MNLQGDRSKPTRDPDFSVEEWHFFIDEMVQWNSWSKTLYNIRIKDNTFQWYDPCSQWRGYPNGGDNIMRAFNLFMSNKLEEALIL